MVLVDALEADIGGKKFMFGHPATFSYSPGESSGTLSMLEGGKVTLPWKLTKVSVSDRRIKCETMTVDYVHSTIKPTSHWLILLTV